MEELKTILLAIMTPLVPVLVGYLIAFINKKMKAANLESSTRDLELMQKIVLEAVSYVAQQFNAELKDGDRKTTSSEKLNLAKSFATSLAKKYGVSESVIDLVGPMIEAALARNPNL